MANEQIKVPLFAASEILTAANMNISAGTGVPVFATTVTRDAAFGGAGEKVLAEGQLCYLSASNIVQYYDGAAWATVGPASASALTLVKAQTIGTTVSTVNVTSAFNSTYDNYKITVTGGVISGGAEMAMILGATTTGYYYASITATYAAGAVGNTAGSNAASFARIGQGTTGMFNANFDLMAPNLAKPTILQGIIAFNETTGRGGTVAGFVDNTTQYTDFTLSNAFSATFTGGTVRVYGYANS